MLCALTILATVYSTFTVPTHNQGVLAIPEYIQTRTCDPFALNCNVETNWTGVDTAPIGTVPACLIGPRVPAGAVCCLWAGTPKREEKLACKPVIYNKDLLFARSVCRTCGDGVVRCSDVAMHEPNAVCTARPGGGCPCTLWPSQGTCVYP